MSAPPATAPRIVPLGESAFTVRFHGPAEETRRAVAALAAAVARSPLAGRVEVAPAYESVGVFFDALREDAPAVARNLRSILERLDSGAAAEPESTRHEIPVRYDGEDLAWVAETAGLSPADVVALHAAPLYRVRFVGFLPGWAYLEGLDPALAVPRLARPRPRVPAGAVAIADRFSGVYPFASPGGWRLLGRTEERVFDPRAARPARFASGDRVRFVPA